MKVAILNDTHHGARNDSVHFERMISEFYDSVFFPYLKDHGIGYIVHLGDLVDKRKSISFRTSYTMKRCLFDVAYNEGYRIDIIPGNHDIFYRNSLMINAIEELLDGKYDNVRFIKEPEIVEIDGAEILFVPWICDENREQCYNALGTAKTDLVFGHFEIAGFEMEPGRVMDRGMDRKVFDRFDLVLSGHYHHKSTDGLIYYLGNQYQLTWMDYNDPRGFHVFDTETRELEFVENPNQMFHKIEYDGETEVDKDYSYLSGKYVKVIVIDKEDVDRYNVFLDKIHEIDVADLSISDNIGFDVEEVDIDVDISKDSMDTVMDCVEDLELPSHIKKEVLKKHMRSIYTEMVDANKI